jgi:hypothetical protein
VEGACAVHAYSLVGSDSCIGGGGTRLTAHFAMQAVRAGVVASEGTPPTLRGTLGTWSCAGRSGTPVVQGAVVDTLPLCAAACDLRGECLAFSHVAGSTGGICKLHGALHEGLIPQFNTFGEFTLDSHQNGTEQARHSQILEYFEYYKYLAQPRAARAAFDLCCWQSRSLPIGHRRERQHHLHAKARAQTPARCKSCGMLV